MRHNLACDSREYGATVLIIQPGGRFPVRDLRGLCAWKMCLCCARFRSGRGSREIIGKRKSSSAPGSNSSRSSSHQAGAEARRPRVRAPLRLERHSSSAAPSHAGGRAPRKVPQTSEPTSSPPETEEVPVRITHIILYTTTYNRPTKLASEQPPLCSRNPQG